VIGRRRSARQWRIKQRAAAKSNARYYGDGGTISGTRHLHVEVHDGRVTAVWFRCQMLPFEQVNVDGTRARDLSDVMLPELTGVEVTRDGT
jgi:hypothetical protein